jgi:hypothetical protein
MSDKRRHEKERAAEFWRGLDSSERFELGDQLVLGTFNWREWGLPTLPGSVFLNHVDYLRMLWECEEPT